MSGKIGNLPFTGTSGIRVAYIHALRDRGWTLESIGTPLGITRERVRQLHMSWQPDDPWADLVMSDYTRFPLPDPPRYPEKPKMSRDNLPSEKTLARLLELKPKAMKVRSTSPRYRKEAEEYTDLIVYCLEVEKVSAYRMAKCLGVTVAAISTRMIRYGHAETKTGKSKAYQKIHTKNRYRKGRK